MSLFVERKLNSAFGEIQLAITRAEHISVQGTPVVRDTKFNCHLHFWRQADGTYAVRDQDRPNMTRAWVDGMSNSDYSKPAPPTYFAKVLAEWTKVINEFVVANPQDFVVAEDKDIAREIESAEAKVQKAREALAEAQGALDNLRARRRAHQMKQGRSNTCDKQGCAISYPHSQHA